MHLASIHQISVIDEEDTEGYLLLEGGKDREKIKMLIQTYFMPF